MIQGAIQPNHIPVNKYTLSVPGMPPITFTTVSGIEQELETVDLPDRTTASGGNTKAFEFTAQTPEHHAAEQVAMEGWLAAAVAAAPGYKKACTLTKTPVGGGTPRNFTILGVYPFKRKLPDLDMKNEGEMGVVEWTFKGDLILPA
jgi:hypothetical protein